jgi:L-Ala-D/L-Glu epimerase
MREHARIERIELFGARMAIRSPFRIAIGTIDSADNLFVRLTCGDGREGIGEGAPTPCITGDTLRTDMAAASELAPLLVGKDPLDLEGRLAELRQALHGNPVVRCAFDMALHDLVGRITGLPLYALLGGANREIISDFTLGIGTPEVMAAEAVRTVTNGFGKIKVKLGTDRRGDVERVRRIREAVGGDVALRIDANQGWDEPTARLALADMGGYGVEYCESPVAAWNLPAMARLRGQSPIPLMADEALRDARDAMALAHAGACDYFNIKLDKSGGIREAVRIAAVAEAAGIRCMAGCMMESRFGLTAAAHVASALPIIAFANLDSSHFLREDPVRGGVEIRGESLRLTDEPGLGATLDPAFLEGCERRAFE